MKRVGIAFSTKDRADLSRQTIVPLLQLDKFDLWWIDGSVTAEGQELPGEYNHEMHVVSGVRGGADAAIVYALTEMLKAGYEFIGICENDVLLAADWFERTMGLFESGADDGLVVGAASARCYEDRILVQRDGFAVCHNLGAGHVVFSRRAAELVLQFYRTGWWPDQRALFAQLSGVDIGRYAAFRANVQWLTADWGFDAVLAQHGLASLALTPSAVEMIGQDPSLEDQGLHLVNAEVERFRNEDAFALYRHSTARIRDGEWRPQVITPIHRTSLNGGASLIFPHQLPADLEGDWRLKWSQGFGPFSWQAKDAGMPADSCRMQFEAFGPIVVLVSGGDRTAKVSIKDTGSGYEIDPEVPPASHGITQLAVPGGMSLREIVVYIADGGVFYGIQTQEPQPISNRKFDYSTLPPV